MLLGFKRRFAQYVWEGSKTHTIRGFRKNPPKVGETCHCYVDPRQKTMALLGRWECVRVETIRIEITWHYCASFGRVWVEGQSLTEDEANVLAWRDGFRGSSGYCANCAVPSSVDKAFAEMVAYWVKLHPKRRAGTRYGFRGHIIHWKYIEATRATKLPGVARAA